MTVGETLTEARNQAGLSVDELSERTKIRETVIRSIERDDYDALGGDLYVRGYVRALAGAVGIDAQPLIHEYDLVRAADGPHERASGSTGKHAKGFPAAAPGDAPGATAAPGADQGGSTDGPAAPAGPAAPVAASGEPGAGPAEAHAAPAEAEAEAEAAAPALAAAEPAAAAPAEADRTRFDLPPVNEDPAATQFDLPMVPAEAEAAEEPAAPTVQLPVVADPPPVPADTPPLADGPAPAGPGETPAEAAGPEPEPAPVPAAPMPADLDLVLPGAAPTGPFGPESLATPVPLPPPLPDPLVDTRHDLPPITDDLMAAGYDLGPEPRPGEPSAGGGPETSVIPAFGLMPDAPARPGGPAGFPAAARADGRRGRGSLIVAAAVAIVVAAGVTLGLTLTAGGTTAGTSNAPVVRPGTPTGTSASGASPDAAASASASASASRASASASAAAQASKQAAASAVAVSLPLASARAFGPAGFADGDDPGNAGDTIATGATQSWATQWYATADFGMLKHGTGLLIDLGRPSTVAGVRLGLSQYRGANLEIRLGNGTAPSDLKAVKAARNVGGVVRLALRHPAVGRYLLVWFTKLPPDGQGHYQETVSHVMVSGHR